MGRVNRDASKRSFPFVPACSNHAFSAREWDDLRRYGLKLEQLASGTLRPASPKQEAFAACFAAASDREPTEYFEKLWAKYRFRVEWEKDPENRLAMGPPRTIEQDGFGTRDDFKRLHGYSIESWNTKRRGR